MGFFRKKEVRVVVRWSLPWNCAARRIPRQRRCFDGKEPADLVAGKRASHPLLCGEGQAKRRPHRPISPWSMRKKRRLRLRPAERKGVSIEHLGKADDFRKKGTADLEDFWTMGSILPTCFTGDRRVKRLLQKETIATSNPIGASGRKGLTVVGVKIQHGSCRRIEVVAVGTPSRKRGRRARLAKSGDNVDGWRLSERKPNRCEGDSIGALDRSELG